MNPKYEELMEHVEKTEALKAAIVLFDWDTETLAPPRAAELTARMIGSLSAQYFDATVNGRMRELLAALKDAEDLSEAQAAVVRKLNSKTETKATAARIMTLFLMLFPIIVLYPPSK